MTCILRFYGNAVDANAFQKAFPALVPYRAETRNLTMNICFDLSTPEFAKLHQQIDPAIAFLSTHKDVITAMRLFKGVEGGVLDFAVEAPKEFFNINNHLPFALIKLAAEIGLEIEISIYCSSKE